MRSLFTTSAPAEIKPPAAALSADDLRARFVATEAAEDAAASDFKAAQKRVTELEAAAVASIIRGENPAGGILEAREAVAQAQVRLTAAEGAVNELSNQLEATEAAEHEAACGEFRAELERKARSLYDTLIATADMNRDLIAFGQDGVDRGFISRRAIIFEFPGLTREAVRVWLANSGIAPADMLRPVEWPRRSAPDKVLLRLHTHHAGKNPGEIYLAPLKEARRLVGARQAEVVSGEDAPFVSGDAA